MNAPSLGYLEVVIPDDSAGRPLTAGEQAVIADLERRLLLETSVPVRERLATRPARVGASAPARSRGIPQAAGPLLVLLGTAFFLVAVLITAGGGLLGVAAVLASVVATALLWPLLPAALGGPARPSRRSSRARGPVRRSR